MLVALALAAAVPTAAPLLPVTKWVVEYDDDMCVLSRGYRLDDKDITLAFRPYPMGTETEIVLVVSGAASSVAHRKAEITFLPAASSKDGSFERYSLTKPSRSLVRMTLGQDSLAGIDAADAIAIRLDGAGQYSFGLPSIKSGLRALSTCQADLLKSWGIDQAEHDGVATLPAGNVAALFGPNAYPFEALRARQQGKTTAVVMVTNTGATTACAVVSTSGSAILDRATCSILRGARFKPGRDKDGKAVAAHLVIPVRWVLPS